MIHIRHSINEKEFDTLCQMENSMVFTDINHKQWTVALSESYNTESDIKIPAMQFHSLCGGDVISIIKPRLEIIFQFALQDIGINRIHNIIRKHHGN